MSISNLNYNIKTQIQFDLKQGFKSKEIDLSNKDIFYLETLESIQHERFRRLLDFYICVVEENGHQFIFEGSRFIEAYLRKSKVLRNPFTNLPIEAFMVYRARRDAPELIQILDDKQVSKPINYLPILFNDHDRTDHDRGECYSRFAECFISRSNTNNETAIKNWFIAAVLGYKKAQINTLFFSVREKIQPYIKLLTLFSISESIKDSRFLSLCGVCFRSCFFLKKNLQHSFYYHYKAAIIGNVCSIAQLIYSYEKGLGVSQNPHKASLWRQFIPVDWQDRPIEEYLKILGKDPDLNLIQKTEELDLPKELLTLEPGINEPDPDKLFPGMKEELEKALKGIYMAERWEKHEKDLAKVIRIRSLPKHFFWADEILEVD